MEFTFILEGAGWAKARLQSGEKLADVTASYLSDALGDLLRAVGKLISGSSEERSSWEEEPGEFRWIFNATEDRTTLRVIWFNSRWHPIFDDYGRLTRHDELPDDRGQTVFETQEPLVDVVRGIEAGAPAVLREHGRAGYREAWGSGGFPAVELGIL